MSKPCEAPCPKCGSLDILRRFYKRSEKIESRDYDKPPLPRWVGGSGYTWWASRDLISHHCRCCQYDWVDGPLPKQGGKKQSAPASTLETGGDDVPR
jgi:hypothetical protein